VDTSKSAIAELMRIAWRSVGQILEWVASEAGRQVDLLDGLRRIGIDEISRREGYSRRACKSRARVNATCHLLTNGIGFPHHGRS